MMRRRRPGRLSVRVQALWVVAVLVALMLVVRLVACRRFVPRSAAAASSNPPQHSSPRCRRPVERPEARGRCLWLANPHRVAPAPQTLTLKTNRDRQNWWQSQWLRRGLLLVPSALVVAGLMNLFGQRPATARATTASARLAVTAPTHARSGLIYAARFRVDALRELKQATLVLDQGWADGYTVNGQAPQPVTQGSSDGRITTASVTSRLGTKSHSG